MLHVVLSGKDFKREYKGHQFVKLTNGDEYHNGYQFQTGLNVDSIPFAPQGSCQAGGIYFCLLQNMSMWLDYARSPMVYVRWVTIPDDALIWVEKNKFKADMVILSERQKIGDLKEWEDAEYCLEAVRWNDTSLQYVLEQTPEICLEAVGQNTYALQYVNKQTAELCLEAVRRNGLALQYVKEQTPELCLEAVKKNGYALEFVREQTPELCLEAVKENSRALRYVKEQTQEICLAAVKQNRYVWEYVKEKTPKLHLAAFGIV